MTKEITQDGTVVKNGSEELIFATELEADEYMDTVRESWL